MCSCAHSPLGPLISVVLHMLHTKTAPPPRRTCTRASRRWGGAISSSSISRSGSTSRAALFSRSLSFLHGDRWGMVGVGWCAQEQWMVGVHAAMPSEVAQPRNTSHGTQPANPSSQHCHPTAPLYTLPTCTHPGTQTRAGTPPAAQTGRPGPAGRTRPASPWGKVRVGAGGALALQKDQTKSRIRSRRPGWTARQAVDAAAPVTLHRKAEQVGCKPKCWDNHLSSHLRRVRCKSSALPQAAARRCASAVLPSLTAAFSTTCGI